MQNKIFPRPYTENRFDQPTDVAGRDAGFSLKENKSGTRSRSLFNFHFNEANPAFVVKRAMAVAGRMALLFEGKQVRFTYLKAPTDQPSVVLDVARLRTGQDGIIRLYDTQENSREFRVDLIEFEFEEQHKRVICSSPDYVLLLEVV